MRFDIMTLFPDMVRTVLGESIIGRAQAAAASPSRRTTYEITPRTSITVWMIRRMAAGAVC